MATEQLQRPVEETMHQEEHQHVSHEQPLEHNRPQPLPTQAFASSNVCQSTTKNLGFDQMVMPKSASPCSGGKANAGHQTHEHETPKASHGLAEVGQHAHSKGDKKMKDKKEKKEGKCEDKKKIKEKKSDHGKKNKKKHGKKSSKDDTSSSSDSD